MRDKKYKHYIKADMCKNARLLQLYELEWSEKKEIVKDIINHNLNKSTRLYARKCKLVDLDNNKYREFINSNHLYGYKSASVKYGLVINNILYAVMSFSKHNIYGYELNRYAVKCGYSVVGGASKLFKHFTNIYKGSILSYADRRFSSGNLYEKLGFELCGITKPNYSYIKGYYKYNRQDFQKHKLKQKLENFDENKTEIENMFDNNYRILYDAGHYRYVYNKQKGIYGKLL